MFREHFITCFIDDKFGVQNRHHTGVDIICYECDYPHSDSLWPQSPEHLMRNLEGIPDDDINKITHRNAMRIYSFDPFKHIPREQCTVGALRAQATHVDTQPRSASGERPLASGETRVVTSGDVIKMMERAGMITEDA